MNKTQTKTFNFKILKASKPFDEVRVSHANLNTTPMFIQTPMTLNTHYIESHKSSSKLKQTPYNPQIIVKNYKDKSASVIKTHRPSIYCNEWPIDQQEKKGLPSIG